jgi:alpha-1,3-glucosyltransferase
MYDVPTLALVCLVATAAASLPSNLILFMQPTKANFVLSLINTSLAFFLFSFQVFRMFFFSNTFPDNSPG